MALPITSATREPACAAAAPRPASRQHTDAMRRMVNGMLRSSPESTNPITSSCPTLRRGQARCRTTGVEVTLERGGGTDGASGEMRQRAGGGQGAGEVEAQDAGSSALVPNINADEVKAQSAAP